MSDSGIIDIRGKIYTAPNGCDYLVTEAGEIYRHVKSSKNKNTMYRQVGLGRNNYTTVHVLICEMFHGSRPSQDHQVRHLDGDRLNNAASNLCWGTAKENAADAMRHGMTPIGVNRHNARLDESAVIEIRGHKKRYGLWRELAAKYGVNESTISDVWHRRTWSWV